MIEPQTINVGGVVLYPQIRVRTLSKKRQVSARHVQLVACIAQVRPQGNNVERRGRIRSELADEPGQMSWDTRSRESGGESVATFSIVIMFDRCLSSADGMKERKRRMKSKE
ncbi:MAG TPA: hypothetical protein VFF30_19550 [Nitrososphaerales archaeon]|nr:hypothetical protein [Nitrososphaerales archaeon]